MKKVITMGEVLIDFMPTGEYAFQAKPGGAPANVCACVSRLGGKGFYLGRMATDTFASFLKDEMQKCDIDLSFVTEDEKAKTALAFVTLKNGERSFAFYRDNTADLLFAPEDVKADMLERGDVLHFGSLGLGSLSSRKAHAKAIMQAENKGAIVSFDINIRENLWASRKEMLDAIVGFLPYADIVKMSDDELAIMCGRDDISPNTENEDIKSMFAISDKATLIVLTKGDKGATVYDRELNSYSVDAIKGNIVDTTGAGDSFIGAILFMLTNSKAELSVNGMKNALKFATAVSSIVCSEKGAMNAMPKYNEVIEYIKSKKLDYIL